jgi:O-antigen/teichoic acid export membrane protein
MSKVAVARDMGIGAIVRVWTQATAFVVILEAGRTLELNEFGVYAMASVFLIVLNTLIYSGIYEYLLKTDDFRAVADTCFCINLAIAACGSLIIVALAPLIAALAAAPSVEPMMFWLAPTALVGAVTSWQEAILLRRKTVTAYYVIWFCSETISAALALTLLLHGMHLYALVGYRYSQCICNFVAYLLYTRDFPRLAWQAEQARTALFFALPLYGSRLVGIVANYSADLIIGIMASPAAAGSYRLASRMIFGFSEVWFQPIKTIAWVRFTTAARRGIGLGPEWLGLMVVLSMLVWPTLGGVAILSEQLTDAVLGPAWHAAAEVVVILAVAKATALFEVFLDPLMTVSNQVRRLLSIRVAASIIAVIGFTVLARFGAIAAAWVQAGVYLLLAAITIRIGTGDTNVRWRVFLLALLPGIAATLLTMLAAVVTRDAMSGTNLPPIAKLACDIGASGVAWVLVAGVAFHRRVEPALLQLRERLARMAVR